MTQRKHAAGPDFFLVAGHGVGATSLRAYCRIVGLPLRFPWQEELPRLKDPLPLVGCIIDRPARIPASWRRDIPIFWLLRDPFAALFNVINNNIWFSSATVAHRNWPWAVSAASLASFCHGHRANLSLLHSSRLLSVYGGRRDLLYCLDHQCLYQDSICETMQFICNALGFDRQDIVS